MTDLNAMSIEDLKKLRKDVEKAIETYHEREKLAALAEIEAIAREKGFSLPELLKSTGKKKSGGGVPRYANPENPAQTWTGRGRRPGWLDSALKSGRALEDFRIGG